MVDEPLFSSGKDTWLTPQRIVDRLVKLGPIVLDPCSSPASIVPAKHVFYEADDGLAFRWDSDEPDGVIYVNPPYSKVDEWAPVVAEEGLALRHKRDVIMLVAARTETRWFQKLWTADCFVFIRGRLQFLDPAQSDVERLARAGVAQADEKKKNTNAPFPSVLVCWTSRVAEIERCFGDMGEVLCRYEIPF